MPAHPRFEDLEKTLENLERFIPFDPGKVEHLAREVAARGCRMAICDIAPLGIAVARRAGIPSILIENFTWDWIYSAYAGRDHRFASIARYLRERFREADIHIQTDPLCRRSPRADIVVPPISRPVRTPPGDMRRALGVPDGAPLVLITMGGFQTEYAFWDALGRHRDIWFVVPGGAGTRRDATPHIIPLAQDSLLFHPDLVNCCDVVAAKASYSTVAEACQAGAGYACVLRARVP
jgi:hypothetical protein